MSHETILALLYILYRKLKAVSQYSPVRIDDFAEGQLAAHLQVTLVFWQVT